MPSHLSLYVVKAPKRVRGEPKVFSADIFVRRRLEQPTRGVESTVVYLLIIHHGFCSIMFLESIP